MASRSIARFVYKGNWLGPYREMRMARCKLVSIQEAREVEIKFMDETCRVKLALTDLGIDDIS
jgi:hypothetical protein